MKMSLNNRWWLLLGLILGVGVFLILANGVSNVSLTNDKQSPVTQELSDVSATQPQSKAYNVMSFDTPLEAHFAGEKVPLHNIDVKEALDKEMLVNIYWQSNMVFYIKRANRWFPIIEPILKEYNIPDDFKYLAVIESGLLNATSPSGAKGFWQFMKPTAADYNLEVNDYVDERNHLTKATVAACSYLNNAFSKFNNWTLAAASYNMGKAGLLTKLQEQKVNNYYDLLLNAETARYVYRIIAVKYIIANPNQYGFTIASNHLYTPYQTKTIEVTQSIDNLVDFAIENKTNYKTLKLLNPWLINKSLPIKGNKAYQIMLPIEGKGLDNVSETDNKYGNGN